MRHRRRNLWIPAGLAVAMGLGACFVHSRRSLHHAEAALQGGTIAQKGAALRSLAHQRTGRTDAVVLAALGGTAADLRAQATYAISGAHRTDLADELRSAWQRETDSATRFDMIYHWALLAGSAAEPVLRSLRVSKDPWTAMAGARGLLSLGHLDAAESLLAEMACPDAGIRGKAQQAMLAPARAMAAMIGQRLPVGDSDGLPWPPDQATRFTAWWRAHVTGRLLQDYLAWRAEKPQAWQKAHVLLHAWKSRFAGFLQVSKPPPRPLTPHS